MIYCKHNILSSLNYNRTQIDRLIEISEPFYRRFGYSLFTYRRLYKDGSLLHLCTNKNWLEYCYTHHLWTSQTIRQKISSVELGCSKHFLWEDRADPLCNELYEFNIWNGITFYEKHRDFVEIYAFASTKENPEIKISYLENISIIRQFIISFNEKAQSIIETKNDSKLIMTEILIIDNASSFFNKKSFLMEDCRKFYLSGNFRDIYLTKRETELIFKLITKASSKEAAIDMNISPRTVELHLDHIRRKLKCSSTSQIIHIVKSRIESIL